ncbi:hypothetical protein K1W69_02245 [Hoeflea sp. WL0058]|uniref:Uncharacterized protein n=1 Tax=Flavimaribacter sediminis TaxID=2865987 RepID=A0AAE3CZR6_9HYPH|nr:DUF6732 family protein [Flavimaribacter sediminis]MBW8635991.1 hypothetical protein [Flavimaribacter sediminis]
MTRTLAATILIASPVPAFAHMGHLGEVAGHSHWIGLAAALGAAAIAAIAHKAGKKQKSEEESDAETEVDGAEEAAA